MCLFGRRINFESCIYADIWLFLVVITKKWSLQRKVSMVSCSVSVKCFQLDPWLSPWQNGALVNLESIPSGGAGMARQCANYICTAVPVPHKPVPISIASKKLAEGFK